MLLFRLYSAGTLIAFAETTEPWKLTLNALKRNLSNIYQNKDKEHVAVHQTSRGIRIK